jgi:hypothetical protein
MNDLSSSAPRDTDLAEDQSFHYTLSWRCDKSPGIHWMLTWLTPDGEFLADFGVASPDPMKRIATSVRDRVAATRWRDCREILRELESAKDLPRGDAFAVLSKVTGDAERERLFRYRVGDEKRSERAALFLQLVDAIEDRLARHYRRLDYIHLLCACAEEMVGSRDGEPDPEHQALIARLEVREPGFSREQVEIVIDACRKNLEALSVPPVEPLPATLKAMHGPELIGMADLVNECARNWEPVVAMLNAKERPRA